MAILDVMRTVVAPVVIPLFTDTPLVFERTETIYNPLTGASVPTTSDVTLKATPLLQFTEQELRDNGLRKSDSKVIVPALDADNSGLDLLPGTEAKVYATRGADRYRVLPVKRVASGDEDAILILGLRR